MLDPDGHNVEVVNHNRQQLYRLDGILTFMPSSILLSIAILTEVAATVSLRFAHGFTNPLPSAIVVVGYGISFWMLALVLKQLPIGLTYAVWSAAGTAADRRDRDLRLRRGRHHAEARLARTHHPGRRRPQPRRHPFTRRDTRTHLLDAAVAVIRRDGAQALTLDAVAAQAGVSKGGLLYHFKSKRQLLEAMVARWMTTREAEFDDDRARRRLRRLGFVRTSHLGGAGQEERAAETGLLAAIAADPALLATVRERYAIWQDRVEREGSDPVEATVARLAADGLWLAELLGLAPPPGAAARAGPGPAARPGPTRLTRQSTRYDPRHVAARCGRATR